MEIPQLHRFYHLLVEGLGLVVEGLGFRIGGWVFRVGSEIFQFLTPSEWPELFLNGWTFPETFGSRHSARDRDMPRPGFSLPSFYWAYVFFGNLRCLPIPKVLLKFFFLWCIFGHRLRFKVNKTSPVFFWVVWFLLVGFWTCSWTKSSEGLITWICVWWLLTLYHCKSPWKNTIWENMCWKFFLGMVAKQIQG